MANSPINESGIKDFNKDLEANIQKIERLSKAADKASNSINSLEASYNRLAGLAQEPVNLKVRGPSKGGGSSNKGSGGSKGNNKKNDPMIKITQLSSTASSAAKPVSALAGTVTKLGLATGGTIAAIALLSKVTMEAQKNTSNYARSLNIMNQSLSKLDEMSLDTSSKIRSLNNKVSNLIQGIGDALAPVLNFIVSVLDAATPFLNGNETKAKVGGVQSAISASAHQSGFTTDSSNWLASNTYQKAMQLTSKYNEEASAIADKLAQAWLTGSDAAKDYGVVVNDNVLAGYLWEKGIDIVNVEITDAMKQKYRYDLMMEETSADDQAELDKQIKKWTQLGFMIDKTKGKLFSFDEVIQLVAADDVIPDLGKADLIDENVKDLESVEYPIIPYVGPPEGPNIGLDGFLRIPVVYDGPGPLELPVFEPINIPVLTPGIELLRQLLTMIAAIPAAVPIQIPISVPQFAMLPIILQYLTAIEKVWNSTIAISVPQINILPQIINYLQRIVGTKSVVVNISVIGMELLRQAEALLQRVSSMAGSRSISARSSGGGSLLNGVSHINTSSYKNTNVISSWTPGVSQSSYEAAYGTGLSGAFNADIDNMLTRLGIQSETKTGLTTDQLNSAMGDWISNGAGQQAAAAAAALATAGIASGLSGAGATATGASNTISLTASNAAQAALEAGSSGATLALPAASTPLALPAASTSSTTVVSIADWISQLLSAGAGFADGGIGTHEVHNATLFENNKKEAIIPLETDRGIDYLAAAMNKAGFSGENSSGDIVVNLTLSGINLADDDAQWERVGKKIAEVIDIQKARRGELNYGSSF